MRTYSKISTVSLFCVSLCIGLYLFFLNPQLDSFFSGSDGKEPYVYFANRIFEANYSYISESILLPLFARVIGASQSPYRYLILCAIATILILPNVAWLAQSYFKNTTQSVSLLVVFILTYRYLHEFLLSFPDPLTILLISALCFQRKQQFIFIAAFLTGLSHFSMASLGLCACALLIFCANANDRILQQKLAKHVVLGLIAAKIFLSLWYAIFEYQLESRLSIVVSNGAQSFIDSYQTQQLEFWLTPGIPFLVAYGAICAYFAFCNQIAFALALLLSISLAYAGLFFATDGLRVFAVIVVGPYLIALRQIITELYPKVCHVESDKVKCFISALSREFRWIALGLTCASFWTLLTLKAKNKGLLINNITEVHIFMVSLNPVILYLWFTSILMFAVIAIPFLRRLTIWLGFAKISVVLPLAIVMTQLFRQELMPPGPMTLVQKILAFAVFLGISCLMMKFKFLIVYRRYQSNIERLGHLLFR